MHHGYWQELLCGSSTHAHGDSLEYLSHIHTHAHTLRARKVLRITTLTVSALTEQRCAIIKHPALTLPSLNRELGFFRVLKMYLAKAANSFFISLSASCLTNQDQIKDWSLDAVHEAKTIILSCRRCTMHQFTVRLTTFDLLLLGLPFQISGRLQKCIDAHCA